MVFYLYKKQGFRRGDKTIKRLICFKASAYFLCRSRLARPSDLFRYVAQKRGLPTKRMADAAQSKLEAMMLGMQAYRYL